MQRSPSVRCDTVSACEPRVVPAEGRARKPGYQEKRAAERRDRLFALLVKLAESSERCPTEEQLGQQLGVGSSTIYDDVRALERAGRIVTNSRLGAGRVVMIPSLRIQTAEPTTQKLASRFRPPKQIAAQHSALVQSLKPKRRVSVAQAGSEQAAIEEYLQVNGATKCPPRFASESQAGDTFNRRAVPKGSRYA